MTRYEIADCPSCGGSEHTPVAGSDAIRDELEQLWAFHTRRLRGDTPPEQLHDRITFSQHPPLRVVRCDRCTLLFRNPRERADELMDTYGDEEPGDAALEPLFDTQKQSYRTQALRLASIAGRSGRGLEVGSYVGAFLAAAAGIGWDFTGIDINDAANTFASERGLSVRSGTIEATDPARKYDAVAFWNCFDQLPDPSAAATAARQRLRDGGLLCIRVPNGAFYAAWRARLNTPLRPLARLLLAHNNLLGFPYRHGFSPASLTPLLERAGFAIVHVYGDTLVPVADRWTRPWARAEERAVKAALRSLSAAGSPWIEVYARAV
ncbi:MAG TPA: class I SAM-dependent methyltransferase [Longimicrobiales bacterium]|nr:class I SAM-dependent methyltransferase [Longimicrobiales bacterium]